MSLEMGRGWIHDRTDGLIFWEEAAGFHTVTDAVYKLDGQILLSAM